MIKVRVWSKELDSADFVLATELPSKTVVSELDLLGLLPTCPSKVGGCSSGAPTHHWRGAKWCPGGRPLKAPQLV